VSGYAFRQNSSFISDIESYFNSLDSQYIQELSAQVQIEEYIRKVVSRARTIEIWTHNNSVQQLDALLAYYVNEHAREIFVTHLSVRKEKNGLGFASSLLKELTKVCKEDEPLKTWKISLEVSSSNLRAIKLYKKFNFSIHSQSESILKMKKVL